MKKKNVNGVYEILNENVDVYVSYSSNYNTIVYDTHVCTSSEVSRENA